MTLAAKVRKIGKTKTYPNGTFFHRCKNRGDASTHYRVLAPRKENLGRTHILASSTLEPRVRQIELEVGEYLLPCVMFSSSEIKPNP
jgi:hypothetical protein